ncbi:radical SAM protein [Nocardia sp. NPDC057227]|uniref:radical SAM protein n=1 Tax=Nocardia sp. NPDC057227 TaxID=3346056 RepID=UPI00362B6A1A
MIEEVTGIRRIRMLYLQLLYRCNFECGHCFHGERLRYQDAFTSVQASNLMRLMRHEHGIEAVTLLGGEPFVYRDLARVVRYAKHDLGLAVEICTNGYRIAPRLREIASCVDLLRVSLEGIGDTNDHVRQAGSYTAALESLALARDLGVPTGVTMTVNRYNIGEVIELARILESLGVAQLKLHRLRPIGNAAARPEMVVRDSTEYSVMREKLRRAVLNIEVVLDDDLAEGSSSSCAAPAPRREIDRIEVDPRGALTMSCKAVGTDAQAFWYEKDGDRIVHRPGPDDEVLVGIPDVVYRHA